MTIIDGKSVGATLAAETGDFVRSLGTSQNLKPGLAVVIVGNDPASRIYVNHKVKKAAELAIHSVKHELPENASQADVLGLIEVLNQDPAIHGILVQSPPPAHIDERRIIETITPEKDVDCFHPYNVGKLAIGDTDGFVPCTPAGIMVLLQRYDITVAGRHAVVVGRSNIVGRPMTLLLSRKSRYGNATVTLCHSRTADIADVIRQGDIVVAAIGKPGFITGDMVKPGCVIIDVGINRVDDPTAKRGYRLVGDTDFESVSQKASYMTPVPGGVGPMTIAMLMANTVRACCLQNGLAPPDHPF